MAGTVQIVYVLEVSVAGTPLPKEAEEMVSSVIVDNSFHLPDLAVVEMTDPGGLLIGTHGMRIGEALTVAVRDADSPAAAIFSGEITAVEMDFDHLGARTVLRAHDKSHRLMRGRRTKAWRNVTYSDIVRELASGAGIPIGKLDATPQVYPQVSQAAVEDWHFMRHLADQVGFRLAVVDGKLEFFRPTPPPPGGPTSVTSTAALHYAVGGEALARLRVSLSSTGQVSGTEVRGWNPKTKQPVTATATPAASTASLPSSPASLAAAFGGRPDFAVARNAVDQQATAEAIATAAAGEAGGTFAEVEAEVVGDPRLRPGAVVSLGGVSPQLCGPYTLSATRHVYDHLGYRTTFVVGDRRDRSLLGLVGGTTVASPGATQIPGVATAIVTNITDSEGPMCRVKLKFPWLSDDFESDWARTTQLGAGAKRGFEILPEVNDEVLVAFEQGDFNAPVVIGGVHNGVDVPPKPNAEVVNGGKVVERLFMSRTGHLLVFDDSEATPGVAILTGDGTTKVVLERGPTGVTVQSTKPIIVKSDQDVSVEGMNVNVTAKAELNMKAAVVKITADGPVQVKGAVIQLN